LAKIKAPGKNQNSILSGAKYTRKGYIGLLGFRKALTEIKYLNIKTEQVTGQK